MTHSRRLRGSLTLLLRGLVGCLLITGSVRPARAAPVADMAPPDPPAGSAPLPGGELTRVRMMSEKVALQIQDPVGDNPGLASVDATFIMRNEGPGAETMQARFPLDTTAAGHRICEIPMIYDYQPITGMAVWVDGRPVDVGYTSTAVELWPTSDSNTGVDPTPATITRRCWATFDVSFPPGQDVSVQVRYETVPLVFGSQAAYDYILETGGAWYGTIGAGVVEVVFPYDLSAENVIGCRGPVECDIVGRAMRWTFTDLEPEFGDNVKALVVPPAVWRRILNERQRVSRDAGDGEVWGRLGWAYKDAIVERRGFRWDETGTAFYRQSVAAYQQALALLPQDADWHYGYADLLCWNAEWNLIDTTRNDAITACLRELHAALTLRPGHAAASERLAQIAEEWGVVVRTENGFDFPFLTATPRVASPEPLFPTDTALPPTATRRAATATARTSLTAQLPVAQRTAVATPTPAPVVPASVPPTGEWSWLLALIVPALLVAVGHGLRSRTAETPK